MTISISDLSVKELEAKRTGSVDRGDCSVSKMTQMPPL
jgi:hypothetical protein